MQETFLQSKSIHELRNIAEGYGITEVFSKDAAELRQEILVKQENIQPEFKEPAPSRNEYDTRLMTKRPAKTVEQEAALKLLELHIERGLVLTFPEPDRWHMRYKEREDTGTLRMPARVLVNCADRLIK